MIEKIAKKSAEVAQEDGGYIVRDGIAYCNTCGEPRQTKIDLDGEQRIVGCACRCMLEKRKADGRERIQKLQKLGGVSPRCTFDRAQPSKTMDMCRRYAAGWNEVHKRGAGLLLWGDVGCGKTFAAHCIANELIKRDVPVFSTSLSRVLNSGFDKTEIIRRIRETPLVVFDDLGAERSSEYALETIFMLVDERYRSELPLIVTTNLTLSELKNPANIDYKRIYDRILQRCAALHFEGASKREEKAEEMMQFMRGLLLGEVVKRDSMRKEKTALDAANIQSGKMETI